MSLSGKTLKDTFKDLLQCDNSNNGVDTTLRNIKDGEGTGSSLWLSDDVVRVFPTNDNTTSAFNVRANGGGVVFEVDTTNELVKASGNYVNTQDAYFGVSANHSASWDANKHYAIPFATNTQQSSGQQDDLELGTGTDPATTFTTAEGTGTRASDLVTFTWYVPDAMSIDSVISLEGADAAAGDTTRMHLFSYDFTSGATACLTNGTLVAHNSDVTNAGSEQPYYTSWTVDSAAVTAGKVILCAFRSDSVNSDYAVNITVKYHLT